MRSLRWIVVSIALVSCGGGTPQPSKLSSTWSAPSILSNVPADSPYVVAWLESVGEKVSRRLWEGAESYASELRRGAELLRSTPSAQRDPAARFVIALADELRGNDMARWWTDLGFDTKGRFVLYGLSIWPVMRAEVANPGRLRSAIARVLSAADIQVKQGSLGGHSYWIAGGSDVTFVVAVLEREAVAALVPTRALQGALPLVLGVHKPARSLASTSKVPELLGRHHLLGFLIGYLDARNAVDIVTSERPNELDAPLHALTGAVSPACRSDLDRLVALAPRMVFGYRKLDEVGFDGVAVIETAPSVISALNKLHAVVPELSASSSARPLMSFGVAIDPGELVGWLRGVTRQLQDHPFACPWFAGINEAGAELAREIAAPLPPMLRGVRGFSVVVDDATVTPPSVDGHLIIAGERVADAVSSFANNLPWLAGIPLKNDGRPIAIPLQQLGLPLASAHFAMTSDRLVIASGSGSAQRVTAHLTTPAPRSSPLLMMTLDGRRMQKLLASLGESDSERFGAFGSVGFSLDVAGEGIGLGVWGTWSDAAAIAQPPRAEP